MFAQADCDENIKYFLSSDTESKKIYDVIKPNFQFVDIGLEFEISTISNLVSGTYFIDVDGVRSVFIVK